MDEPKMVPESDLIALKESHARETEELTTKHATALEAAGAEHVEKVKTSESKAKTAEEELTRLRATVTTFEEASKNHASTAQERDELKGKVTIAEKALKEAEDGLRGQYADQLTAGYSIPESALKDKTVAELKTILDTLKQTRSPNSRDYTAGGGSGGDPPKTTGREKIAAGLDGGELRRM
jgi:alanyl-tRNA synthetase